MTPDIVIPINFIFIDKTRVTSPFVECLYAQSSTFLMSLNMCSPSISLVMLSEEAVVIPYAVKERAKLLNLS